MLIGFGFSWPRALERTPRLSAPPAAAETLMKFLRVVDVMRTKTMTAFVIQRNWRRLASSAVAPIISGISARLEVDWVMRAFLILGGLITSLLLAGCGGTDRRQSVDPAATSSTPSYIELRSKISA